MSTESIASQANCNYLTDLFFEAVEETALPAAIGLATAGPVGAVSASSFALGLFFTEKTAEYFLPDLKGNKYYQVGKHLFRAGFTAANSANLMKSKHFCLTKDWVLKSGNFAFDVGKSICGYIFGSTVHRASDSVMNQCNVKSEKLKLVVRTVSGVVLGYLTITTQDSFYVQKYYCSPSGFVAPMCESWKSKCNR
ncbi:hypothetical protein D5R81_19085 [Parashewanella spongiae]|uniref:Uncharacterized protein n=1 Tax=Parashewanella spongiae TaxID=342950 RepID=A0A3A6TTS0_9GAMM|nr:hypothetical protein [Parashewanella spongiae]MCL1080145.1 hypothetical protein [Parashewanella spongiae]RJY04873.1 hypothetical protein D5R81_19085 [Parashewanella spongiae]